MDASLFIAKVLGLYFIIVGIFWFVRRDYLAEVVNDYLTSPALMAVSGAVALISGLIILVANPVIAIDWRGLITLMGILAVLKGLIRLFSPKSVSLLSKKILKTQTYNYIGTAVIIIGLILAYFGFRG